MRTPTFLLALALPAAALGADPYLEPGPLPDLPGVPQLTPGEPARALLRLPQADDGVVQRLSRQGLHFLPGADGVLEVGGVYGVEGDIHTLRRLAGEGWDLHLARPLDSLLPPTDVTGPELQIDAVRASGPTPVDGFDGAGVTILDIDTSIDPFHPHFFRADGGAWSWFDADGDDVLSPGVDGVDLDEDGALSSDEVLELADAWRGYYDVATQDWRELYNDNALDPQRDWLWLDEDGDGSRDFGPDNGYSDDDPSFGEWVFVPDDADGDGIIGPDEKLLLLGSHRVRSVTTVDGTFRRGENLSDLQGTSYWRNDHGTGVAGILVGGQRPGQRDNTGLLPEADLLIWDHSGGDEVHQLYALDLAQAEGVDVVLHEYSQWVGQFLDGSSSLEQAMDSLAEEGVAQVCPAGNLGTTGKHAVAESVDGLIEFAFWVPDWMGQDFTYLVVELHSLSEIPDLACTLRAGDGSTVELSWSGYDEDLGDAAVWSADTTSSRSTRWQAMVWSEDGPLPFGSWRISCQHEFPWDRPFHAYLSDGTGWNEGSSFDDATPKSTLCWPSTADDCVTIGAYGAQFPYWYGEEIGERHLYSSMGPRIDGGKTVDVSAPADAFTAAPLVQPEDLIDPPYRLFSGTSGAGPHAAAVAALLKQQDPDADGLEVRERMRAGSVVDEFVEADVSGELPDDGWGYGKLRAWQALLDGEAPAAPDLPGHVELLVEPLQDDEGRCVATLQMLLDGQPADTARFDLDYDGSWDTDFVTSHDLEVQPGQQLWIRAQAAQGGWHAGGAVFHGAMPSPCPSEAGGCQDCSQADSATGPALLLLVPLLTRRRRS